MLIWQEKSFTDRIETIALVNWIFIISFQLVKCNHMKYGEEYQKRIAY